jgi:hypothetical protein
MRLKISFQYFRLGSPKALQFQATDACPTVALAGMPWRNQNGNGKREVLDGHNMFKQ